MKVQIKLISYFTPTEQRRIAREDILKTKWEREKDKYIPSCEICKKRFSCLLYEKGYHDEQFKCLKRRVYLMYKFGYNLFNIKPNTIGSELGIKEFFKQAKEIDRIEKYSKEYDSTEQVKLTNYLQGGMRHAN